MFQTIHTTFRTMSAKQTITVKCENCGKKLRRTVSSEKTVNPWNKNADGSVKSPAQVYADCVKSVEKQIKEYRIESCNACQNNEASK